MHRRTLLAAPAVAAAPLAPAAVQAQAEWRLDRPVRIVVPFAAGGSTDTTARLVADALGWALVQPVVVENRAGAAGTIAAEYVARSAPDGYTRSMGTNTTHATAPALYPNLGYHPLRDFVAVVQAVFTPNTVTIHPSVPADTIQEFIAYAKANPGKVNYGSAGPGSSQHLSAALLAHMAGLEMIHVAYRGGAPAAADLIAGRVQLVINPLIEVLPFINSGQIRALGVTTRQRAPQMPHLPSLGEVLPGFEVAGLAGLFAPAGTPPAVVQRISRETVAVMRQPAMRSRVEELGSLPVAVPAAEFATFQAGEVPKWAELVRISGAKLE
jgi:tripartite-type tricarboxylate transporter receptor subunit TctC